MKRRLAAIAGVFALCLLYWFFANKQAPAPAAAPRVQAVSKQQPTPKHQPKQVRPQPRRVVQDLPKSREEEPEEVDEEGVRQLLIDVVTPNGDPGKGMIVPVECPGFRRIGMGLYQAELGPCVLAVRRREGMLRIPGEKVSIEVGPGLEPMYVQLETPEQRIGGVGVMFSTTPDGMRVLGVVPGGPAQAAGLQVGDLITTVDGVPTSELDQDDFVQAMTGPEGSDVEFEVAVRSDTGGFFYEVHSVKRQFLEKGPS